MKLSFSAFFRVALFLPITVWIIDSLLPMGALDFLAFSFEIVAVPYIIFALLCLFASARLPAKRLQLFSMALPLLFIPFALVGMFVLFSVTDTDPSQNFSELAASVFDDLLPVSFIVAMLGYFYVAIGWLLYLALSLGGHLLEQRT